MLRLVTQVLIEHPYRERDRNASCESNVEQQTAGGSDGVTMLRNGIPTRARTSYLREGTIQLRQGNNNKISRFNENHFYTWFAF